MSKNAGRKTKLTEDEVKELIYLFKKEKNIHGKVGYKEMYLFNLELVQQGKYKKSVGEDFWRKTGRLGRKMIDLTNEAFSNELSSSTNMSDFIPNFTEIINKHYDNKEELIKEMVLIERKFYQNVKKRKLLEEKVKYYQSKFEKTEERLDYIQELLFKLLRYSSNKKVPLVNLLDTKEKSQTLIVKKALEGIFSNPADFYNWYNEKLSESLTIKDNILPLKNKKTLADEYEDIF